MPDLVSKIDIPVYFLHGRYDYTVEGTSAEAYLNQFDSPTKEFIWFENSAHSPLFEEWEETKLVLQKILELPPLTKQ